MQAVLYCHGNGEDVVVGRPIRRRSEQGKLRASVFVFDYRGYGHSEGTPNEAGCIADGCAAQEWLANKVKMDKSPIVVWGSSLGSGVAVAVAAENGARALILESSFTSMPDVAALHYPWLPVRWIMKNRYDNLSRIKNYTGSMFQSHGAADTLIPIKLAKALYDAGPERKRWLEFKGGHNDAPPPHYYELVADYLRSTP